MSDTKIEDGGPAFPHTRVYPDTSGLVRDGLSIRDYFAAQALNGMISSCPMTDRTAVHKGAWAGVAYDFADAMIAARKSGGGHDENG